MPAVERFPSIVSRFERNNVIPDKPSSSGETYSESDESDRSPSQPLRSSPSAFSKQIQILRQQSEGINEECEDFISSTSAETISNSSSSNKENSPSCSNSKPSKPCRKSKEAEDVVSNEPDDVTSVYKERRSSMSEAKKPRKSILKNSPYISKEDIRTSSNESGIHKHHQSVGFSPYQSMRHKNKITPHKPFEASEDRTEPGNIDAIDKYYETNHYTVTGIYTKNNHRLHQYVNEMREEDEDSDRKSRKRSISMAHSSKSVPIIPINNRFHQSFYWFAHNYKKIGFRHLCMLLLVLVYTLLGAALFYCIESRYELETMKIHKLRLEKVIFEIAQRLELEILDPQKLTNITQMEYFIQRAYKKLLNAEELYSGSTYYKHEDPKNLKWTYGSALFFSMNVYTTTGYGSIAPSSNIGKAFVILYGLFFVPLTAVVIRDLGQWALLYLTKMYTVITDSFRRARGFVDKFDEDEIISLPIKFSMSVMLLYLMSATLFIFEYDALSGPPGSGITFFHSFYFSFISMSTIGLGDIMPNNVTFSPLITVMFFFGMPILKVVNRVTYICLENGVFGSMTVLENRLDQAWSKATVIPCETTGGVQHQQDELMRKKSIISEGLIPDENEGTLPNEYLNNFTIRSIATFMRANGDVYGGGFGRVNMRRGDLRNVANLDNNQATIGGGGGPNP